MICCARKWFERFLNGPTDDSPPHCCRAHARCRSSCDVDGVLTDGKLNYFGSDEMKSFSVLDGFGITLAKQAGWKVAMLTAGKRPA